ncbi:MAG: carboxypeptidase-like regulatory domain-containing protein, partial [Bacteroidota bacterium]
MNLLTAKPGYNRLTILLQVFSLLLLCTSAQAQQAFKGTVVNGEGIKLKGADVMNQTNGNSTTTDAEGAFTISLQEGSNDLFIYIDGYTLLQETVASGEVTRTFTLVKTLEINEVIIQKEREKFFALGHLKDIDETTINAGKKTEVVNIEMLTANKGANNSRQIYAQVVGLTIN